MNTALKSLWDKFTDTLSQTLIHPQYYVKKYEQTAIDFATEYSKGVLLDIGCGRMPYKKKLLPYIDKYIGLDSPETAKLYHAENKPDLFADATNIPLPPKSCDTILMLQVLEHLPEPEKALHEAARLLKLKGVLIISTVQLYPVHDPPYDFFRFTKFGLQFILKQTGFKIVKIKEEGNFFVLQFQNFNIYLMLILKSFAEKKMGILLAIILAPLFLILTLSSNLLTLPFLLFDKTTRFGIVETVVAKR